MCYEILPHTADLRVHARGQTLEALFRNALRGMSAVIQPAAMAEPPNSERALSLTAPDATALLVDFLSEALALAHVNREIYPDVRFEELSPRALRATLRVVPVHTFIEDVKAVTYHGAEVKATHHGYEVTIVYDI